MEEQINILLKTIDGLNATIASLSEAQKKQSEDHRKEVESLNQLFGRKSEKLPIYDPNCPDLFADQFVDLMQQAEEKLDEAVAEIEKTTKAERKQKKQNRIMMEDLPGLEREVIEPEDIDLSLYKKMGEEVTHIVKHQPCMIYIKEIIRPKYGL